MSTLRESEIAQGKDIHDCLRIARENHTRLINNTRGDPVAIRNTQHMSAWYEGIQFALQLPQVQPNPCAGIFKHKWLNPSCVKNGCQSLNQ